MTWRPETGDRQHRSPLPQHSSKLLTRNSVVCFLEYVKICVNVFGILPRFLKNLLESEKLVCMARMKTALVSSSFGSFISRHRFPRHLATSIWNTVFQNSRKASRTPQNALAGRVFETPGLLCTMHLFAPSNKNRIIDKIFPFTTKLCGSMWWKSRAT